MVVREGLEVGLLSVVYRSFEIEVTAEFVKLRHLGNIETAPDLDLNSHVLHQRKC